MLLESKHYWNKVQLQYQRSCSTYSDLNSIPFLFLPQKLHASWA